MSSLCTIIYIIIGLSNIYSCQLFYFMFTTYTFSVVYNQAYQYNSQNKHLTSLYYSRNTRFSYVIYCIWLVITNYIIIINYSPFDLTITICVVNIKIRFSFLSFFVYTLSRIRGCKLSPKVNSHEQRGYRFNYVLCK